MDEAALAGDRPPCAVVEPCADLAPLREAVRASRRVWRWHWERFWLLRWENTLRRPGWRVDEEGRAWLRMREHVRHHAQLRLRLAARAAMTDVRIDG
jgi:hypothetical protein